MELVAVGGANLVWHPRSRRDGSSVLAAHNRHGKCKLSVESSVRHIWNPFSEWSGLLIDNSLQRVHERVLGRRSGIDSTGSARKPTVARGYNLQDAYTSATEFVPPSKQVANTFVSTAKEHRRNVSRIATEGDNVNRETLQPEDMIIAPRQAGRVGGSRVIRKGYAESDVGNAKLQQSHQKPVESRVAGASSTISSIALAAVPLLLIAPVMGFLARCVVDYIHAQVEDEVGRRFAEMESWQARHRPRVKRWQTILDEDRDEFQPDLLTAPAVPEYQSDPCSRGLHQPLAARDDTEMDSWHQIPSGKETEEERKRRQKHDYEDLKRSYTKLEPLYEKFLADSGLNGSGYWRGAAES